ncbi:MAG: hypothetical protein WDN31_01880 [Hyphomicrobium sp.]
MLGWDLVRLLGEHREAWDDPLYWTVGYPLMLAAAFMLGPRLPRASLALGPRRRRRAGGLGDLPRICHRWCVEPPAPRRLRATYFSVHPGCLRRTVAAPTLAGVEPCPSPRSASSSSAPTPSWWVRELAHASGMQFGYDQESVAWVEGFIERQRAEFPDTSRGLVSVLGSYLGEAIIEAVPGADWAEDDNGGARHPLSHRRYGLPVQQGRQADRRGAGERRVDPQLLQHKRELRGSRQAR